MKNMLQNPTFVLSLFVTLICEYILINILMFKNINNFDTIVILSLAGYLALVPSIVYFRLKEYYSK